MAQTIKKFFFLSILVFSVICFFVFGLHEYLTLESIKASQADFKHLYDHNPISVIGAFFLIYIPAIALSLPGATLLGLAAGALFGALTGTIIVSFASSIGATLACATARYFLRDLVQRKFGKRLRSVNEGMKREGEFYLFSMRLIPIIPFFVINLIMGLTPLSLRRFYWVSQLGMLPGTFVFVNAGSQLAQIESLSGIFSPELLASFALLGIFPLIAKKGIAWFRQRKGENETALTPSSFADSGGNMGDSLRMEAAAIADGCSECGACVKQCAYLKTYGSPGGVAKRLLENDGEGRLTAYECSLCNLCGAICPEKLSPASMFLEMRRDALNADEVSLANYKSLLAYEKQGNSKLFSWYGLPRDCDTVFFPGCTFQGTRPETTWELFTHLKKSIPSLGVVLDCCNKPSHDLGRQEHFESMFHEMRTYLSNKGVKRVVVACPNCHKVFKKYGEDITVITAYEHMATHGLPECGGDTDVNLTAVIHDPCPLRTETESHEAVRTLARQRGVQIEEIRNRGKRTLCCGEGGTVEAVRPEFSREWGRKRQEQADGRGILTYCAGCANYLSRVGTVTHLLDVVFFPEKIRKGTFKLVKSPFTYLARLKLKRRFIRSMTAETSRERTYCIDKEHKELANACTFEDRLRILRHKALGIGLAILLAIGLFIVVSKFMYILDAYLYTAEFHGMFLESNISAAKVDLLAEYFAALGAAGSLPSLFVANIVQGLIAPFSGGILPQAVLTAFGATQGIFLQALAALLGASVFYGLGKLLFGDVLPMIRKTRLPLTGWLYPLLGGVLIFPAVPMILPAVLAPLFRLRLKPLLGIMLLASVIRFALV